MLGKSKHLKNMYKYKWRIGQIRGLEGRDPRRSKKTEELCFLNLENIILGFYTFYENVRKMFIKPSKTNHISCFGAPGVV